MLTGVLSLILIVLISAFVISMVYRGSEKMNDCAHVHVIVMSLSSLISLTAAGILAIFMHSAFILCILFGLLVGYLIGRPLSLFAVVDGMVAGWMGGMMGVMLPMVAHLSPLWFILFMDAIFLFLIAVMIKLFSQIRQAPSQAVLKSRAENQTLSS